MPEYSTVIVGTRHRGRDAVEAIAQMQPGEFVQLEREPRNRHDRYAIGCHYKGLHVGYVPRQANEPLAIEMDRGAVVSALVDRPPKFSNKGFMVAEPKLRVTVGEPQL